MSAELDAAMDLLKEVKSATGIEYDKGLDIWWLPAESGPLAFRSLHDALVRFGASVPAQADAVREQVADRHLTEPEVMKRIRHEPVLWMAYTLGRMHGRDSASQHAEPSVDEPTCEWSVTGTGAFRCVLPLGHNGLHRVVFGDAEHLGVAVPVVASQHAEPRVSDLRRAWQTISHERVARVIRDAGWTGSLNLSVMDVAIPALLNELERIAREQQETIDG